MLLTFSQLTTNYCLTGKNMNDKIEGALVIGFILLIAAWVVLACG